MKREGAETRRRVPIEAAAGGPSAAPAVDEDAPLLAMVELAVRAGDLEAAKRALAELETRRRERAGVVELAHARRTK